MRRGRGFSSLILEVNACDLIAIVVLSGQLEQLGSDELSHCLLAAVRDDGLVLDGGLEVGDEVRVERGRKDQDVEHFVEDDVFHFLYLVLRNYDTFLIHDE